MHHSQLFNKPQASVSNRLLSIMKVAVIGASSLVFVSGCQATKSLFGNIEDGSLDYKKAEKLDPLQLPADQETAPFVPLYPTPAVGTNTLELENDSGKRFELPAPYRQVPTDNEAE